MQNRLSSSGSIIVCEQERGGSLGDCDAAGIVYYARYFDWFTDGRIALLNKLPFISTIFHEQGIQ